MMKQPDICGSYPDDVPSANHEVTMQVICDDAIEPVLKVYR
jgi:hypothetical protein